MEKMDKKHTEELYADFRKGSEGALECLHKD